jgi:hypothetical protein
VVDILVAGLVNELTRTGISAQLAVDAAMDAAPLLDRLCDVPLTKRDVLWPTDMFPKIRDKIWPEQSIYPILVVRSRNLPSLGSPRVELLNSQSAAERIFRGVQGVAAVVHIGVLCKVVLSSMAMADSELEIDGKPRLRPGHAELKSRAERQTHKKNR